MQMSQRRQIVNNSSSSPSKVSRSITLKSSTLKSSASNKAEVNPGLFMRFLNQAGTNSKKNLNNHLRRTQQLYTDTSTTAMSSQIGGGGGNNLRASLGSMPRQHTSRQQASIFKTDQSNNQSLPSSNHGSLPRLKESTQRKVSTANRKREKGLWLSHKRTLIQEDR